jgi:hypothetical protein
MRLLLIIGISAVFNLTLVGGIFHALKGRPQVNEPTTIIVPAAIESSITNAMIQTLRSIAPTTIEFQWKQIVSDDFKKYRDNLVAIGCPNLTIRDIITAEINEQFLQRRKLLLARVQKEFWDRAIRGEAAIRNEWGEPLGALNEERQQMIEDVLGNVERAVTEGIPRRLVEPLSWLPEMKQGRMLDIELQYQWKLREWTKNIAAREGGDPNTEDNSRRQEIEKEYADAKMELLTVEELEEMQWRGSRESLWAAGLSGFEPTEEEWKMVSKLRSDFEKAQQYSQDSDSSHDEILKWQEQLQAELSRAMKEALGAERFAEYERAGEHEFQQVYNITERYGLPQTMALRAYEIQQAALVKAQQIRDMADISTEQRENTLKEIRRETERTLGSALGQRVFSTYKEYNGDWLGNL